jgi:peptidoglycan/xylan/chitin deacetylase (PgdA/CDA1 family)/CelD/BcsL family acetyltransferase involved in cellulose biosynthesis
MRIVEIREEAKLQQLRPAWERLLYDSASNTVFLTWEWLSAWWRAYGSAGNLRLLAAFDEGDTLRGIAPLYCKAARKYGVTKLVWSFIGDGSNDSDYLDFIATRGFEKEVLKSFRAYWAEHVNRAAVLALNEIPATSPCLPLLKQLAEQQDYVWTEKETPCGTVHLPEKWEDYLLTLKPRFRTKVRSVLRNLENRREVRFGFCRTMEEIERTLPVLFDLHTRRWAQDGKPGVFRWQSKRDFYFDVSALFSDRGWLRFSWMEWNGQILACQYGFAYGSTYFHLQEGYEPSAEHWNVGVGLRAWTIQQFLQEGLREYDFLSGLGRHKMDWGAVSKGSKQIQLAPRSVSNTVFCEGPEWEFKIRESLRKAVPEKALAYRKTRAERQQLANFRRSESGKPVALSRNNWMRKAAAHCYFHSRLPVLARSFREHYQISVSSHRKLPGISCHRRTTPCARILYYHRVNNEQDLFFPAISTELFEQQMRFVSQHYKVVPLSALLTHLQEGSPEIVVAVTFDDGYRDNYQNAFPILQHYGLPATIFLTTGTVDSREPLWFEQLANALKKTTQESVDLEVDIPRRFWMRTQAERLHANQQIFQLLRALPDCDRMDWLQRILRQLAVADGDELRNKMLTWDEIRAMRAHGVEFGGHTVSHPFLSHLTYEQASWEIRECKRRIEEELQFPVEHFAYPNGREEDFSEWNKELLNNAGYRSAVTTKWGMNYQSTDRLELRRGGPWEESAALFAYKFDWYQLVND